MNYRSFLLLLSFVNTLAFYNISKFNKNHFFFSRKKKSLQNNEESGTDETDNETVARYTVNKFIRLGRSKDQDGKSNIWSVEPTMRVDEQKPGDISDLNKNILVGGLVTTGILASLPILYFLNMIFPDPSNY